MKKNMTFFFHPLTEWHAKLHPQHLWNTHVSLSRKYLQSWPHQQAKAAFLKITWQLRINSLEMHFMIVIESIKCISSLQEILVYSELFQQTKCSIRAACQLLLMLPVNYDFIIAWVDSFIEQPRNCFPWRTENCLKFSLLSIFICGLIPSDLYGLFQIICCYWCW